MMSALTTAHNKTGTNVLFFMLHLLYLWFAKGANIDPRVATERPIALKLAMAFASTLRSWRNKQWFFALLTPNSLGLIVFNRYD